MFGQQQPAFGAAAPAFGQAVAGAPRALAGTIDGDVEAPVPQDLDGVSSFTFSPATAHYCITSWNNQAYIYEYSNANGQSVGRSMQALQAPILCSAWKPDGSGVFLGSCDKSVRLWDIASNSQTQVAAHDAPVRHVAWAAKINCLVTASWDKTFKFWDTRSPTPAYQGQLSERVYAMDVRDDLMVVGTADRNIHALFLASPQQVKTTQSQLKWQTRSLALFPDMAPERQGYLIGSIEGRVAVTYLNEGPVAPATQSKSFTFKCHRDGTGNSDIHAVNVLAFQPQFGTFITAGADGTYHVWDKDSKQRIKSVTGKMEYTLPNGQKSPAPITCGAFDRTGQIFGYGVSYDWSRGYSEYHPSHMKSTAFLHVCKEDDVKPKPKANVAGRGR